MFKNWVIKINSIKKPFWIGVLVEGTEGKHCPREVFSPKL